MKKEMTINKRTQMSMVNMMITPIAEIYSKVMGMKFNNADVLHILQVQIALLLLLLPVEFNAFYHFSMLLWFALSLLQCRYLGSKFASDDG